MRVVLLITKGEIGGAQTHLIELCRSLRSQCEFLVLIGGDKQSPLRDALTAMGVRVESVGALSNKVSMRSLATSVRQVVRHLRSWRADVIHVHSAMASVIGRLAGRLARVPVVYTVHGFAFKPEFPLARRILSFAGEKVLAPLSQHVICVSRAERELALQLGIPAQKVSVIDNGISDRQSRAQPHKEPATLIMVARMSFQKRHDLLLESLKVLHERGIAPPPTLLAGDGPLGVSLRESAAASELSCVSFCGDVSNVPEMLRRAQVFVLLSRYEGHPISVLEAMRAGLPIVATDLPAMRGMMTNGVDGFLTSDDPREIANVLQRLMADPFLRMRMGAAARRRYESDFSAAVMGDKVNRVYREVAGIFEPAEAAAAAH